MAQLQWLMFSSTQGLSIDHYYRTMSYASIKGVKLPPLDEVLGVSSNDGNSNEFDDRYEKQALKRLEEMNGK